MTWDTQRRLPSDINSLNQGVNGCIDSNNHQIFEKLVKKGQLAEITGFSESYISKLMTQGLPAIKSGRAVRFRVSKVMAWLEKRSTL